MPAAEAATTAANDATAAAISATDDANTATSAAEEATMEANTAAGLANAAAETASAAATNANEAAYDAEQATARANNAVASLVTEKRVLNITGSNIQPYSSDFDAEKQTFALKTGNVVTVYISGVSYNVAHTTWQNFSEIVTALNSLPVSWRKGIASKMCFPNCFYNNIYASTGNDLFTALWIPYSTGFPVNTEIIATMTWTVED